MIGPVIPGLTEHEVPAILSAAAKAGARFAGHIMLRLPFGVKDLFDRWLERHAPGKRKKILGRIRGVRGGKLNETRFGARMSGAAPIADQIHQLFSITCRRFGLADHAPDLSVEAFRRPAPAQLNLFES
jgi:DNA repair photolyase